MRSKNYSRLLYPLVLFSAFLSLGQSYVSEQEFMKFKEVAEGLVEPVVVATDDASLCDAVAKLRGELASQSIDMQRRSIYAACYAAVRDYRDLGENKRQELLQILTEGVTFDKDSGIRGKCVIFLYELVYDMKIAISKQESIKNIEMAYGNESRKSRYMVLLLVCSGSPKADGVIDSLSDKNPSYYRRPFYSPEWAATLIKAQRGDLNSIKRLILLSERSNPEDRFTLQFQDFQAIHNKLAVAYLHEYLKSNITLPKTVEVLPEVYAASKASMALSRMLEGFPAFTDYNTPEAIAACRKWMEENPDCKFRK